MKPKAIAIIAVIALGIIAVIWSIHKSNSPSDHANSNSENLNSDSATTSSTASTTTASTRAIGMGTTAENRTMMLLHIIEKNTDTMPQRLTDPSNATAIDPIEIVDGQIIVRNDLEKELIQNKSLILAPGVTLDQCHVLIMCTTSYSGKGRAWEQQQYYGFEKLPAMIPVNPGFAGDKIDYDMEASDESFAAALMGVRLMGDLKQIEITNENDKPSVHVDGKSIDLASGKLVELLKQTKSIAVSEVALTSTPIGADKSKPTAAFPATNYGSIQFATSLSIQYLGRFNVVSSKNDEVPEP